MHPDLILVLLVYGIVAAVFCVAICRGSARGKRISGEPDREGDS